MPRPLQIFDEYRYGPRSILRPGDRFRVTGGPVYITDAGQKIPMYERGIFRFRSFCVRGAAQWLEAVRESDHRAVVLWVGKPVRCRVIPNLHRRPYHIRAIKSSRRPPREA